MSIVSLPSLLTEIQTTFSAPASGIAAGSTQATRAASPTAAQLQVHWADLSEEIVAATWANRFDLSAADFRQYLPAWLCHALRVSVDSPLNLVPLLELLKLPTELPPPDAGASDDLVAQLQAQLDLTNQALQRFISRMSPLTSAQGRAVAHFLEYVRDTAGESTWVQLADRTLQRYWFRYS
jgi:hypothetical protein